MWARGEVRKGDERRKAFAILLNQLDDRGISGNECETHGHRCGNAPQIAATALNLASHTSSLVCAPIHLAMMSGTTGQNSCAVWAHSEVFCSSADRAGASLA
jgi:hypothetical protein